MFFPARLAQYGQTEPFALCAVREKAIEGKCTGQSPADAPLGRYVKRYGFRSESFGDICDVLLVFFRVECARAVNQQSAGFQCVPHVVDDPPLTGGTVPDIRDTPFLATGRVFAKHPFARTGHISHDQVEQFA